MIKNPTLPFFAVTACVVLWTPRAQAVPIFLGAAGPSNWAVLEIADNNASNGPGTGNGNVSIAAAPPYGSITGDVGIDGRGNISDSGAPIAGAVFMGTNAASGGISPAPSGGVEQDSNSETALSAAVADANYYASWYASPATNPVSGGGIGVSSITSVGDGTLAPGTYDLTDFQLNGGTLRLVSNAIYIFNISQNLTLQGGAQILDSTPAFVLFNITGTHGVSMNGGIHNEAQLDGIILAPHAQVSLSPGFVFGEIISGDNINISSGGSVVQTPTDFCD
jgi:hypothetical protein